MSSAEDLFDLFWARLDALPEIVVPQCNWITYVTAGLGYRFD